MPAVAGNFSCPASKHTRDLDSVDYRCTQAKVGVLAISPLALLLPIVFIVSIHFLNVGLMVTPEWTFDRPQIAGATEQDAI